MLMCRDTELMLMFQDMELHQVWLTGTSHTLLSNLAFFLATGHLWASFYHGSWMKQINWPHYASDPLSTAEQQVTVKTGLNSIAGLPNTIGMTDCTYMCFKATDSFLQLNCKQYHSINVQLICDSENHMLNVIFCFQEGVHDAYILENSSVGMCLEQASCPFMEICGVFTVCRLIKKQLTHALKLQGQEDLSSQEQILRRHLWIGRRLEGKFTMNKNVAILVNW